MVKEWNGFQTGKWCEEIDVRDFIQCNYTPYEGDDSFLAEVSEATDRLWKEALALCQKEQEKGGVLDADTAVVSTLTSHQAGYLDGKLEKIVGFQTDAPL